MSGLGFTDFMDVGYFPLQDHAAAQDGTPLGARQMIAGGRITRMTDPADTDSPAETMVEYGKVNGLGTLGDVHPWLFWQTRDRAKRGSGSWMQAVGMMAVDADGYYATIDAQPVRDDRFTNDTRYRQETPNWPQNFPRIARGSLLIGLPGTEEAEQHHQAYWADPRLVAPSNAGPGECGTLVVDLQPSQELCMDDSETPGYGGRHARLQSIFRVIAVGEQQGFANLSGSGNTIALNFGTTSVEGIGNFGACFGEIDNRGGGGPTTGGPSSQGPITGGPSGPTTGPIRPGGDRGRSSYGDQGTGAGAFGGSAGGVDDPEDEVTVAGFGTFAPNPRGNYGVGLLAQRSSAFGPIDLGARGDKHQHGTDRDGHPINAAHISTNAYFFQDNQRDAPIAFEGVYPYPSPLPIPAKAYCSYDAIGSHAFAGGTRSGQWRFWCETPDVAPPGVPTDPPTDPPGGPGRPGGPGPGRPGGPGPGGPGRPGGGGGPSRPGGGPSTGGPRGPKPGKPQGPITPNPGGKRFPGYPPTGPVRPGGPGGGSRPGGGGGRPGGPTRPGGAGGQPSVPCKAPVPTRPIGNNPTRPGGSGPVRPGGSGPVRPGGNATGASGPTRPAGRPRGPVGTPQPIETGVGPVRPGGEPIKGAPAPGGPIRPGAGGRGRGGGRSSGSVGMPSGANDFPTYARELNLGGGEILPMSDTPAGAGAFGTPQKDPREELGRWSGMNHVTNTPEEVPGVVERIGEATSERPGLYSLFRPMAQGFAALQFRPQLTIEGYPNFEHNPQLPTPMYFQDEALRPQTVAVHAFGGQLSGDPDWAYVEDPTTSRARGGTAHGGVVFHPPRFELSDYYGVGDVIDVDDTTSARATTVHVLAAPGVSYSLGKPNADGTLQANGVTIAQEIPTSYAPLVVEHNATEVLRAYDDGTDVVVSLGAGGNGAIIIPNGTTAQQPATPTRGMLRLNTSGANDLVEFYDNAAGWTSLGAGGGGSGITQLTGDVTAGPGSGSQVATIPDETITYAKMQHVSTRYRLLGLSSATGPADVEEVEATASSVDFLAIDATRGDMLYSDTDGSWAALGLTTAGGRSLLQLTGAADKLAKFTSSSASTTVDLTSTGEDIIGANGTQAAQTAIGINDETAHVHFADFIVGNVTANGYATTTSGSGAGTRQLWQFMTAASNNQGVLELGAGTAATGYCSINVGNNAIYTGAASGGGAAFKIGSRSQFGTLSNATDEYIYRFGISNDTTSNGVGSSEIGFRYDRATDGANWQCITRSGGTETKTDSGVAVTASTTGANMQVLEFTVNEAASSVTFQIDGVDVATHTTNIPANRMGYGCEIEASTAYTTNEAVVGIDWLRFECTRSSAR